ncbi:MAG: hypothetical protein KTR32_02070 [Granulosicoccus sp.]|nr:hypothetical protein [Granulosicoccus sp.]
MYKGLDWKKGCCWLLIAIGSLSISPILFAAADSEKFGVGFDRLELPDPMGGTMNISVWYPTKEESGTIGLGPFEFPGTWNAEPAEEIAGLVVVSHGTGGSDLGHRNLGVALAQKGIVAVAPLFPRNNFRDNSGIGQRVVWEGRPLQLASTIHYLQSESVFKNTLGSKPVSLFGFSLGGYTVISLLTGGHDLEYFVSHCEQQASADPVCSFDGLNIAAEMKVIFDQQYQSPLQSISSFNVCSSVLADPMMAPISDSLLKQYPDIPTLVYLPTNENQLAAKFHGDRLGQLNENDLRKEKVTFKVVEDAQHFSFLAPFPAALASSLPAELVSDHIDFNRTAFQQIFAEEVSAYFANTLADCLH